MYHQLCLMQKNKKNKKISNTVTRPKECHLLLYINNSGSLRICPHDCEMYDSEW